MVMDYIINLTIRSREQMKTINISLTDAAHKKLAEIKDAMRLPNLHDTVAKTIDVTYEACIEHSVR